MKEQYSIWKTDQGKGKNNIKLKGETTKINSVIMRDTILFRIKYVIGIIF